MTIRLIAACALACVLSACIVAPPPYHGGGWQDPHFHGGFDHGGYGRR